MYSIKSFRIEKLWGEEDIFVEFNKDLNILVGINGSGKTTIINLIRAIINLDKYSLKNLMFKEAEIFLISIYRKRNDVKISARKSHDGSLMRLEIGKKVYTIDLTDEYNMDDADDAINELSKLVRLKWLPVNRYRNDLDDERAREDYFFEKTTETKYFEELQVEFGKKKLQIEIAINEMNVEFQKKVLELMLYNSNHDNVTKIIETVLDNTKIDFEIESRVIKDAYNLLEVGDKDDKINDKIECHMLEMQNSVKKVNESNKLDVDSLIPLILFNRTMEISGMAKKNQQKRIGLNYKMELFKTIMNKYFENKFEIVLGKEILIFKKTKEGKMKKMKFANLSSGEKQIFILMIEALLIDNRHQMFIADEPELSLHISWQEMILEDIIKLAPNTQVIVATHSPEIVSTDRSKLIKLGGKYGSK